MRYRKTSTAGSHSYVESKKAHLIKTGEESGEEDRGMVRSCSMSTKIHRRNKFLLLYLLYLLHSGLCVKNTALTVFK
jgi:hypothetical protein